MFAIISILFSYAILSSLLTNLAIVTVSIVIFSTFPNYIRDLRLFLDMIVLLFI